jgi:hypothetical protein
MSLLSITVLAHKVFTQGKRGRILPPVDFPKQKVVDFEFRDSTEWDTR